MNHPTREELIAYLYEELDDREQAGIERHLGQCEECRSGVAGWRRTGQRLNDHRVSSRPMLRPTWQPLTRWVALAATAGVIMFGGFLAGRMSGVSRAEIETAIAAAQQRTLVEVGQLAQTQIERESSNTLARIEALQQQQTTDYASLRKALETVAVLTEAGFRRTAERMVQIADATSPANPGSVNP